MILVYRLDLLNPGERLWVLRTHLRWQPQSQELHQEPERDEWHEVVELVRPVHGQAEQHPEEVHSDQHLENKVYMSNDWFRRECGGKKDKTTC